MLRWVAPLICAVSAAQTAPGIHWQFGPATASIGPGADLRVPEGMIYVRGGELRRFFQFTGNPMNGGEVAVAGPASLDWFAVFAWRNYDSLGFDAADSDPEEIARSIRSGSAEANRQRARQGRETLEVLEWAGEPVFDEATGRLEFRLRTQESGGRQLENRFVYFLGAHGLLEVELVREAGTDVAGFERLLEGLSWRPGEHYSKSRGIAPFVIAVMAALAAATLWIRFRRQRGQ